MAYDGELTYPLELQQEIGRGGLGEVYLAYHHRLKKHVVVKKVASGRMRESDLRIEVDLLKNLHHSYLPQVYDFIQTMQGTYTVMEYIEGVSLAQYIAEGIRPPQEHLHTWLLQFCSVLEYLHNNVPPIVHSDIKPENVLITKRGALGGCGNICLIDFNITPTATSSQIVGLSVFYASPEQRYLAQTLRGVADPALGDLAYNIVSLAPTSDIYSLGATFHDLILATIPQVPALPLPRLAEMELPYQEAFLRVIDKATELEPAARHQSAVALRKALLKRERNDTAYRHNHRLQWLVGAASALIFVAGVGCLVGGVTELRTQAYEDAYALFASDVAAGDGTTVVRDALALLNNNDYGSFLASNPLDKASVLHALSDARAKQGDFATAADYLREGLELVKGRAEQEIYYRDYAIVLAYSGRYSDAEEILAEATAANIDSQQCRLIEAQICYLKGDSSKAIVQAQNIVKAATSAETISRAHILLADIYASQSSWAKQIDALLAANAAHPVPDTLRRLADAYLARAQAQPAGSQGANGYYSQACTYLAQLCAQLNPGVTDRLNYSTALRAIGDTVAGQQILSQLEQELPGDYRVLTQLALFNEQTNSLPLALSYCNQALSQVSGNDASAVACRDALQALKSRLTSKGVS